MAGAQIIAIIPILRCTNRAMELTRDISGLSGQRGEAVQTLVGVNRFSF